MINLDIKKDLQYYQDYKISLKLLQQLDYSKYVYPDQTNFHIYSEIKNPYELLVVKSYLAIQNLTKTNLTIWSDYDISNNPLIQPFKKYVTLKIYNPIVEGKDTPLEGKEHLKATGMFHYVQADLFRIIVLHKYGGIFTDMDIVFLRDMVPVMDQEFMYLWGHYTENFEICATVLSLFKNSPLSNLLLEEAAKIPVKEYYEKLWYCCYLYDIVFKKHPFTIFPSAFFNTEWQITPELAKRDMLEGFDFQPFKQTKYTIPTMFPEAFTWHWHNGGGRRRESPESGSKFALYNQLIDNKLLLMGLIK
jgi:hypothetical protein